MLTFVLVFLAMVLATIVYERARQPSRRFDDLPLRRRRVALVVLPLAAIGASSGLSGMAAQRHWDWALVLLVIGSVAVFAWSVWSTVRAMS